MRLRHAEEPVLWKVGDVRDMKEIGTESIDVAFDKGTLDAMIYGSPWSPPEEVLENTGRYMKEVRKGFFTYCLLDSSQSPQVRGIATG